MDVHGLVTGHYGGADLTTRILDGLTGAGKDPDALQVEDLASIDQLHAGFAPATAYLLEVLAPAAGTRLLDVGCGIGGASRMAAARGVRSVTGIDLTPEFVETARTLTERTGLADRVSYVATGGEKLPFPDASFDAAMMIHVGMNVPDKPAVFGEVRRVLAVGARFAIYEQMRCGDGALPYPLPWAEDARSSFVEGPHEYADHLTRAGFEVEDTQNRTAAVAVSPPGGPDDPLSPGVIFGAEFPRRIGNNIAATQAGDLGAILMVARAV